MKADPTLMTLEELVELTDLHVRLKALEDGLALVIAAVLRIETLVLASEVSRVMQPSQPTTYFFSDSSDAQANGYVVMPEAPFK